MTEVGSSVALLDEGVDANVAGVDFSSNSASREGMTLVLSMSVSRSRRAFLTLGSHS